MAIKKIENNILDMNVEYLNNVIEERAVFNYIQQLLEEKSNPYTKTSRELNGTFITMYDYGAEFVFSLDKKFKSVRLICNSDEYVTEYVPYSGRLPWGLFVGITKKEVRELLGVPSFTREKFENSIITFPYLEKYEYSNYVLDLQYNSDSRLSNLLIDVKEFN